MLYNEKGQLTFLSLKEDVVVSQAGVESFITGNVLDNKAVLKLESTERDQSGFTHLRYSVASNGVDLAHKTIIAHLKNGKLVSVNGELSLGATPANSFALSENAALTAALDKIHAEKYMWQEEGETEHVRKRDNDPTFTYYPKGKKVVYEADGVSQYAWQFDIYASKPLYRANVFVNASTGAILAEENMICMVNTPGTAATLYSGTQNITSDLNTGIYRLRETNTGGRSVETYNMKNGSNYSLATDFTSTTSSWNLAYTDKGATDAHWGAEMTYDYYMNTHNRNSIDNQGMKLRSYVHYQVNYYNAFWNGTQMTYGDGNGSGGAGMFAALDVCGHEITHGLTSKTANLVYSNEPGAINESWSDIFGVAIEHYARPNNTNWLMGEDLGSTLRSMSNPNAYGQPDTYLGNNWYSGTGDNGGVHTNSGIGNYWYYLLSVGGSGTNDLGNSYQVTGISMNSAERIAFRALTVYFTSSTNYANARLLTIKAAQDIFGVCSNEVIQTANAWHAVGVGSKYSATTNGSGFYAFNTNVCSLPATINFTNTTTNGTGFLWNFGDGTTSTASNVVHTYTAPGSYNVNLKVTGCSGTDSVFVPSFVNINVVNTPTVANLQACANNTILLNASGNASIFWYDSPTTNTVLGIGAQYVTPPLPLSTTFYVANTYTVPPATGGMSGTSTGPFLTSNSQYLVFDVYQPGTLNSVVVEAQSAGNRTFQLRNSANAIITSTTISLTAGSNTVNLNFALSIGLNYRLGLSSGSASALKRSTVNVNYPYTLGNVAKITGSSAGTGTYIYFYDWNISTNGCSSARIPLQVTLNELPEVYVYAPQNNTAICAGDRITMDGWPVGGFFTGAGMIGNDFQTAGLSPNVYHIDYEYADSNGCVNTSYIDMQVQECTGIDKNSVMEGITVYPNPANDAIVIRNQLAEGNISITDATGRIVRELPLSSNEQQVQIQNLAAGVYFVKISGGSTEKTIRVIKQ